MKSTFPRVPRPDGHRPPRHLTDWAAALTYYGLLSLFPALVAMVSLIGIFGDPRSTTESLTEIIDPPKDQATT